MALCNINYLLYSSLYAWEKKIRDTLPTAKLLSVVRSPLKKREKERDSHPRQGEFTSTFCTRTSPGDEWRDLSTSVRTRRSTAIGFQPNWIRLYKHHGDKPADLVVSMNRSRMKTNRWGRSIVKLPHFGPHTDQIPTEHRKWRCQRGWSLPKTDNVRQFSVTVLFFD